MLEDVEFAAQVPVSHLVALVLDERHEEYGYLAKIDGHDWNEAGVYWLTLEDGTSMDLPEGWGKGIESPIKVFYRRFYNLGEY